MASNRRQLTASNRSTWSTDVPQMFGNILSVDMQTKIPTETNISYNTLLLLPILSLKILLLLILILILILIIIIIVKMTIIQIKALTVPILKYSFGIITCSVNLLSTGKFNLFCIYTQFLSQCAIHSGIRCWVRETYQDRPKTCGAPAGQ
jgi:hypothetical protein